MSPLLDLQRRYRELGRIRLGEKGPKGAPKRRSTFRLTSPNETLLAHAAAAYGGTVQEWKDAPTEGTQYELATGSDTLDVVIPPGQPLSQHWEMWSGGGCARRCDGYEELLSGESCMCPADHEERAAMAQNGRACKPTTRLSVMLPDLPDIGVWRTETHGTNAAVELPGTVALLEQALSAGRLIPAQLRIDNRTSKKNGQTRHFVVPVLELVGITANTLMTGEIPEGLPSGSRPALASPPAPALGAGGESGPAEPVDEVAPQPAEEPEPQRPAPSANVPLLPGEQDDSGRPPFTEADETLAGMEFTRNFSQACRDAGLTDAEKRNIIGRGTSGRLYTTKGVLKSEVPKIREEFKTFVAQKAAEQNQETA